MPTIRVVGDPTFGDAKLNGMRKALENYEFANSAVVEYGGSVCHNVFDKEKKPQPYLKLWSSEKKHYVPLVLALRHLGYDIETAEHFYPKGFKIVRLVSEGERVVHPELEYPLHNGVEKVACKQSSRIFSWDNAPKDYQDPRLEIPQSMLWAGLILNPFGSVLDRELFRIIFDGERGYQIITGDSGIVLNINQQRYSLGAFISITPEIVGNLEITFSTSDEATHTFSIE